MGLQSKLLLYTTLLSYFEKTMKTINFPAMFIWNPERIKGVDS